MYQLPCELFPTGYVRETFNHLRIRTTNHHVDINHQNSDQPLSSHAHLHNHNKIEDCFELGVVYEEKQDPEPNLISSLKEPLKSVTHCIFLKRRQYESSSLCH